ncbi:hypothetical protein HDU81_007024 [Chytriomyces hyalinus]|nr:hypothetical protein HDU81_007024 [Chytriomyces hyalinus]
MNSRSSDNGTFWTGLLLTLFTGPIIGSIPLCCADAGNLRYRAFYLRGMAVSFCITAILLVIITIYVAQQCQQLNNSYRYTDDYGNYYYFTYDCNGVYSRLLPIAAFWLLAGAFIWRRGRAILQAAESQSLPTTMAVVQTAYPPYQNPAPMMQVVTSNQPFPGNEVTPGYAGTPVTLGAPPAYGYDTNTKINTNSVVAYENVAPPGTYASPDGAPPFSVQASNPAPLAQAMSLESLALHLQIPKLVEVTEGIDGVMQMSFKEMHEKYSITSEDFLKIKEYRKNLGLLANKWRIIYTYPVLCKVVAAQELSVLFYQPSKSPMNEPSDTGTFWTGLLISLFAGPAVGAIPLCCADASNVRYRAFYIRGMSVSFWIVAAILTISAISIGQDCQRTYSYYYSDYYGSPYYYRPDCGIVYQIMLPIAAIWALIGGLLYRRSQVLLQTASDLPTVMMAGTMQYNIPVQSQGQGPPLQYATPPIMAPYQQQPSYPVQPSGPPVQVPTAYNGQQYAPPEYSNSVSEKGVSATSAFTSMAGESSQGHTRQASNPPFGAGTPSSPTPVPTAMLQKSLSIESLALLLKIPKLMEISEGMDGVMSMSYKDMNEKYAISSEDYLKVKEYRKRVAQ